jgi:cell division septal protein FtsQ
VGRLALAQPRSVREVLAVPWKQAAAIALAVCAVLALLYLAARETPIFAVRTIEVTGAPKDVRVAVEEAAGPFLGESLAALDGGALVDDLEALPTVRSVTYDRAFPSTLRVFVEPERAVALVKIGSGSWLVSARGRIIGAAPDDEGAALPAFRLPEVSGTQPGRFLTDPEANAILAALALLPERFPARVTTVTFKDAEFTMGLRTEWGAPELRLGDPADMRVKLEVAALVLRSLSAEERVSSLRLSLRLCPHLACKWPVDIVD